MYMQGKKKIKIMDADGAKLDTCVIKDSKDVEALFARWKKKGLF